MTFVHLHTHQDHSLLDGMDSADKWAARAKELGMEALALTDHGNMHGSFEFCDACEKANIKPIVGCELYVYDDRLKKDAQHARKYGHVVALCKDITGYKNLCTIVSDAYQTGFYYKPQTDRHILSKCQEGLIILSGCTGGVISRLILDSKRKQAFNLIAWYRKIFKHNFYLEIQPHDFESQIVVNHFLLQISRKYGIPLVTTNDCHYISTKDAYAHQIMLLVNTKGTLDDLNRGKNVFKFPSTDFDMCTEQEVLGRYAKHPYFHKYKNEILKSISNTGDIARQCTFAMPRKIELPLYISKDSAKANAASGIRRILWGYCKKGWKRKILGSYKDKDAPKRDLAVYKKRLKFEYNTVCKMGLVDYFLIVGDFVRWAKRQNIYVGGARGSVAGCLMAYLLDITDIDPIRFDLMFERFLNPSRTGFGNIPDIDLDFQHDRREEVRQYLIEKYGKDRVASIATFSVLGARSVLKDVGRVFGKPFNVLNSITGKIYNEESITDVLEKNILYEMKLLEKNDPKFVECAKRIEGQKRHAGIHAAGVILTPRPIIEYCPLFVQRGVTAAQWDMYSLADRGLLKIDLLGLKNLTALHKATDMIRRSEPDFDIGDISLEDPRVYEAFRDGDTEAVFQFERENMKALLKSVEPESIIDLAAVNALGRPGARDTGQEEIYLRNKQKGSIPPYAHKCMAKILDPTYGALVFQEQVMALCHEVGGISLAETNDIREAIKHFDAKKMGMYGKQIVEHANTKLGIPLDVATKIWEELKAFSKYGFNKNHSVAYSIISYQTMYAKLYYPYEYMTAVLDVFDDSLEYYLETAINKLGLDVRNVNLHKSDVGFTLHKSKKGEQYIIPGFVMIDGIGVKTAVKIIEKRKRFGKEVTKNLAPGEMNKLINGGCDM